jgi:hypothetical protein
MCFRDSPRSFGPSPIGQNTFVASTYDSRGYSRSTAPISSSAAPRSYTFAVSKKLMPRSYAFRIDWTAFSRSTYPP